jgi:1-acyl-sn-glycerol-3-phosphate acyltransferase
MKVVFRILLFPLTLLRFISIAIITFIMMVLVIVEDYFTGKERKYRFIIQRCWCKLLLFTLGFCVKRNKISVACNYILMPNHRSYTDIFLMGAFSPSAFIAKAEMLKWPLIGTAIQHCKAILVKRDSLKSMVNTMEAITQSINNNIPVTLFPEGTTTFGPGTKVFKSGSFKIAADLNVPIIPCAIVYRDRNHAWVGDDPFISHFLRMMWKPISRVEVRFGEPICSTDMEELKEKTKQAIDGMLSEIESKKGHR